MKPLSEALKAWLDCKGVPVGIPDSCGMPTALTNMGCCILAQHAALWMRGTVVELLFSTLQSDARVAGPPPA